MMFALLTFSCNKEKEWEKPESLRARAWVHSTTTVENRYSVTVEVTDSSCLYFIDEGFGIMEVFRIQESTSSPVPFIGRRTYPFLYQVLPDDAVSVTLPESSLLLYRRDKDVLEVDGATPRTFKAVSLQQATIDHIRELRLRHGRCGNNAVWKVDDNDYLSIFGTGPMDDYAPGNEPPWKQLAVQTMISVAEGITSIGDRAFMGLPLTGIGGSMTSYNVSIPNSVERIGQYAFADIPFLNLNLAWDAKLRVIEAHAFEHSGLHSICIPKNVEEIREYAFNQVQWLDLSFSGNRLRVIGDYAFTGIGGRPSFPPDVQAPSLYIPESVEELGEHALQGHVFQFILSKVPARMGKVPFVSTLSYGVLFFPAETPPSVEFLPLSCPTGVSNWTLVVPKGSENAYRAKSPWNQFKQIEGR
jgi:hypothetical protein